MSDDSATQQTPTVFSSRERAALVAKALSEAARRARFSTKRRRSLAGGKVKTRRVDRLVRLARIASFVVLVALPTIVAGVYFGLVASDQYVSEARFTVRGGLPPSMDKLGALTGAPSMMIVQDTQVIMNFLKSRAVVEALNRTVGLERLYENPDADYFSRLRKGRPIEKVLKYWTRHIDVSIQMPSGIVSFAVAAFRPEDSVALVNAAIDASEHLINRMNDQMRTDAVDLAERERERAQEGLAKARASLERARNEEGMLSADAASKSMNELVTQVQGELIKMQQQYESQRRFVRADAPQLKNLQAKINAAKQEIQKLDQQMTSTGGASSTADGKILSGSMSRLEYANLENTIAEQIYAGSLAALEHAKLASETKLMYLNTFVRPSPAEEAKYPRRAFDILIVSAAGLACWGLVVGLLILVRNRIA